MHDPYRFSDLDEASRARDLKNLRTVAILHRVVGALLALFSCLFIVHIWLGARLMKTQALGTSSPSMGPLFVGLGSAALVFGWAMAGAMIYAGRCIESRKRRQFCLVVAALSTAWFPFGSALGLFTLILLAKPHVRAQFGEDFPPVGGRTLPPDRAAWAGWVSAEAKRRFVRSAIFIAFGLVFVQVAVPIFMFARTIGRAMGSARVVEESEGAAPYGGRLWFIESVHGPSATAPKRLASVGIGDDGAPVVGLDIPGESRFLAADGPRLWILGGRTLAVYEAGHLSTPPSASVPYWPSRLFDYGGRPAYFDWNRSWDQVRMVSLEGEEWRTVPGSAWKTSGKVGRLPGTWSVLPAGSGFDVFMEFGSELRCRHIGADDGLDDPQAWELVTRSGRYWAAVRVADESLVVVPTVRGLFDRALSVLHRTEAGWVVMDTIPAATWGSLGASSPRTGSMDLVLAQANGIETLAVSDGKVQARHTHHQGALAAPFDVRWMIGLTVFGFVPSLVAAALLGRMMRRERIGVLEVGRPLPFASLLRRGLASGIDSSPAWIATIPGWWRVLRAPPGLETTREHLLQSVIVGVACWIGTVLVMSYTEGRWGVTPGKWVCGIRVVGTDTRMCGFPRALLRNALRLVDGTLGFGVGIFVVAFTREWQRLGDLAARTVVVRRAPPASGVV